MASFSLSFSCLYFSLYIFLVSSFSPVDLYLINCGSHEPKTVDPDNRVFTGDGSRETQVLKTGRSIQLSDASPLPGSSLLYHTARVFSRPSKYAFPIKASRTHHLVRLHFQSFSSNSEENYFSQAQFHVLANGFLLLHDFALSGNENSPVIKEFMVPVNSNEIEITFLPREKSKFAFVNAIEVIAAPKDLLADVAQYIDFERNERVNGLLKSGFETVHRVNVGGHKVTPFNDSFWRTWVPDDKFLKSSQGSETFYFGGRVMYRSGGASREVGPDNVYNTARLIRSSNSVIPDVNLTWAFEVEKGYCFLVRMHFCDIASISSHMLYFNVYINGYLAYENLDLSDITNGLLASPFYADFLVDGGSLGFVNVSVGPSNMSLPNTVDAILNGVEIMKINNSMGSFGGEVCAEYVSRRRRSGNTSLLVPLFAAVFLLLTASVFMQRRRNASADTIAWSRLPVDVSEANLKFSNHLPSGKV